MNNEIVTLSSLPEKEKLTLMIEATKRLTTAQALIIKTDDNNQDAGAVLKQIKAETKKLVATRLSLTKPIDLIKKDIMVFFNPIKQQLETAEDIIKSKLVDYGKAKKLEEQKLYEAELRKQNVKGDRLNKQADKLRADGKQELAEVKESQAAEIAFTTPSIPINQHKTQGISTRPKYTGEILNQRAVFNWLISNPDHLDIIDINQGRLNKLMQATKGALKIDGVKVIKTEVVSARI